MHKEKHTFKNTSEKRIEKLTDLKKLVRKQDSRQFERQNWRNKKNDREGLWLN